MKLSKIFIDNNGEPTSNPTMDFPEKPFDGSLDTSRIKVWQEYEQALSKWHEGRMKFENPEEARKHFPNDAWVRSPQDPKWNPDNPFDVDIEVEVVEQKHKFKRRRGFSYIVIAKCLHCGVEREGTKGQYTYPSKRMGSYRAVGVNHKDTEPSCLRQLRLVDKKQ